MDAALLILRLVVGLLLAGLAEFLGGILFALGPFSPLGSLGIAASMLIAISRMHWPRVWVTEGGPASHDPGITPLRSIECGTG